MIPKKYFYLKEVEIPLYRGMLLIVLTDDINELQKHIPDFGGEDIYAHTLLVNWKEGEGFAIVLNFKNDYRKIYNGTITHEAIHATNFIMQERGFVADFSNDEPAAYLAEFVVDEIYILMNEHNFKASI
jgi:hypothetical protein